MGRVISPEEVDVRPLMALLEAAGPRHLLKFHAIEAEFSRKGGEEGSRLQTLVGQIPDFSEVGGSHLPAMSVEDRGLVRGQQQVEIGNRLQRLEGVFNLCRVSGSSRKHAMVGLHLFRFPVGSSLEDLFTLDTFTINTTIPHTNNEIFIFF